jgi:metal-responsive CopG/Arc/MetJ family transcriptional regulator
LQSPTQPDIPHPAMKILVTLSDDLIAKLDAVSVKRGRSAEIEDRLRASFRARREVDDGLGHHGVKARDVK